MPPTPGGGGGPPPPKTGPFFWTAAEPPPPPTPGRFPILGGPKKLPPPGAPPPPPRLSQIPRPCVAARSSCDGPCRRRSNTAVFGSPCPKFDQIPPAFVVLKTPMSVPT